MDKELTKHKKFIRPSQEPTAEACQEYQQLLAQCVQMASDWWESLTVEEKKNWEFRANVADGVFIKHLRGAHGDFVWPPESDHSFKFGWHTNIWIDPREKFSKNLLDLIDKTKFLKLCFEDDKEWLDYGLDDYEDFRVDYEDFRVDYEDYRDDYDGCDFKSLAPGYGYGSLVYCVEGDGKDYTMCNTECGYCGKCDLAFNVEFFK